MPYKPRAPGPYRPMQRNLRARRYRVARKKSGVFKSLVSRNLHHFRRNFTGTDITGSAPYAPYLASSSCQLSSLPNYAEFAALYDRYMITTWQLTFYLRIDPSAQTASTAVYPRMFWIKDYDDVNIPANLNELREHSKMRTAVLSPTRPIKIFIKPSVLDLVYRTALTSSYTPKWRQWVDMAHTDVPHYGLKWAFDDLSNTNYKVSVEQSLWFSCKDTR